MKHTIREELRGVLLFVGTIWGAFLVGQVLPFNVNNFGVTPRSLGGLVGIAAMPFLHANLGHILSNTVPLTILLCLLAGSKARTWPLVAGIVLFGGSLLWVFGRTATHIGASGLIYGLMSFLIVAGIIERRLVPLLVSIFVGFAYGGTLLAGVLPTAGADVSWDGHLAGAIAGGLIGYTLPKDARSTDSVA